MLKHLHDIFFYYFLIWNPATLNNLGAYLTLIQREMTGSLGYTFPIPNRDLLIPNAFASVLSGVSNPTSVIISNAISSIVSNVGTTRASSILFFQLLLQLDNDVMYVPIVSVHIEEFNLQCTSWRWGQPKRLATEANHRGVLSVLAASTVILLLLAPSSLPVINPSSTLKHFSRA